MREKGIGAAGALRNETLGSLAGAEEAADCRGLTRAQFLRVAGLGTLGAALGGTIGCGSDEAEPAAAGEDEGLFDNVGETLDSPEAHEKMLEDSLFDLTRQVVEYMAEGKELTSDPNIPWYVVNGKDEYSSRPMIKLIATGPVQFNGEIKHEFIVSISHDPRPADESGEAHYAAYGYEGGTDMPVHSKEIMLSMLVEDDSLDETAFKMPYSKSQLPAYLEWLDSAEAREILSPSFLSASDNAVDGGAYVEYVGLEKLPKTPEEGVVIGDPLQGKKATTEDIKRTLAAIQERLDAALS